MDDKEFKEYERKIISRETGAMPLGLGFGVEEYSVGAWCPTTDGSGPPTAVVLTIKLRGIEERLVLRLKSKGAVEMLARTLQRYSEEVFGK